MVNIKSNVIFIKCKHLNKTQIKKADKSFSNIFFSNKKGNFDYFIITLIEKYIFYNNIGLNE